MPIDYDAFEDYDYVQGKGKLNKKGEIQKGKEVKGKPVGSHTKFLAREQGRYNRTHKEK